MLGVAGPHHSLFSSVADAKISISGSVDAEDAVKVGGGAAVMPGPETDLTFVGPGINRWKNEADNEPMRSHWTKHMQPTGSCQIDPFAALCPIPSLPIILLPDSWILYKQCLDLIERLLLLALTCDVLLLY